MYFSWPSKSIRRDRSHYSSGPLGPYLLNCDSYKSLMSPHSMEGTIPTGPYHLDCDSCRSQISHSLRSKPFRLVSEQRKTSVLTAREIEREPKDEKRGRWWWGEGGGEEGNACRETPASLPFFPTPSLLFYSRHFWRGVWLSFLVLCSETARKRLLRRIDLPIPTGLVVICVIRDSDRPLWVKC